MIPDGDLREDDFTPDRLAGYPLVVAPDCFTLTENQQRILLDYARGGGKVLVAGRLAEGTSLAEELKKTGNAVFVSLTGKKEEDVPRFMETFEPMYAAAAPVVCRAERIGVQRYDSEGRTFVHVLNYRYDEKADRVIPAEELKLTVRGVGSREPQALTPAGVAVPQMDVLRKGEDAEITLRGAGVYTVIAF